MSFLGKLFETISYYSDEENPLHETEFVMDGWDDLTEEQQKKYLTSMLTGAGIAIVLGGGYVLLDKFVGEKLDIAVTTAYNYIKDNIKECVNKETENDLLKTLSVSDEEITKENIHEFLIDTDLVLYKDEDKKMFAKKGRYFVRNVEEFKQVYKDHLVDNAEYLGVWD